MSRPLSNFDLLWRAYPNPGGTAAQAKATIGGGARQAWIDNTCVLRISRCCNYAGHPIPARRPGLATVTGADRMHYAFRVRELRRYLEQVYGPPHLVHRAPPRDHEPAGAPADAAAARVIPAPFRGRQGLVMFLVPAWADATGHVDLWNGETCVHSDYFGEAEEVLLWDVPGRIAGFSGRVAAGLPALDIDASVGEGGANRTPDVVRIQTLLVERGLHTPIDGTCGAATVTAIRQLQSCFTGQPDGRVDPGQRTWRELNGL